MTKDFKPPDEEYESSYIKHAINIFDLREFKAKLNQRKRKRKRKQK